LLLHRLPVKVIGMGKQHQDEENDNRGALNHIARSISKVADAILRCCESPKPKTRLLVFATGHDERIEKIIVMQVTLSKPIKPGFRRAFTVSTDEAIDKQADGTFAKSEVVEGDSTAPVILPESSATELKGWINGDGSVGNKKVLVRADGHVGEGEVPIELEISYEVASADATAFTNFKEGADEAIPI